MISSGKNERKLGSANKAISYHYHFTFWYLFINLQDAKAVLECTFLA